MCHFRVIRGLGLLATIASLGLTGCGSTVLGTAGAGTKAQTKPNDLDCTLARGNKCWVPVLVKGDLSGCSVSYVFETITAKKNVTVIWYLNQPGFVFDKNFGIAIRNVPAEEFDPQGLGDSAGEFKWHSNGGNPAKPRTFPYDINVYAVDPRDDTRLTKCEAADPVIKNT